MSPKPATRKRSAKDAPSGSDSEPDEEAPHVQTLVAGRERRATAGNRLSTLLTQEADDELELLFAEDEEDVEFEAKDADEEADVRFDSSDDDDDADDGPAGADGDDNLDGERELEREARAERQAKKRKAHDTLFGRSASTKKVKVDPTTTTTKTGAGAKVSNDPVAPTPKASKSRAERSTWVPSADSAARRQSSRKATVQNKEEIRARIKEHEERRRQQIASMDVAAAKRKAKLESGALTQQDRLAEARKTERLNSKSLNRWEETEKQRQAEQKARLAALHDRKLEGPVITWWSGLVRWVNGELRHVGRKAGVDEGRDGRDGRDVKEAQEAKHDGDPSASTPTGADRPGAGVDARSPDLAMPAEDTATAQATVGGNHDRPSSVDRTDATPTPAMHDLPVRTSPKNSPAEAEPESSTRNLVVLENCDAETASSSLAPASAVRDVDLPFRLFFKQRRAVRAPKMMPELCVITARQARFRDPSTQLPYRDVHAYKQIQKLKTNESLWSGLLGCYVGVATPALSNVKGGAAALGAASRGADGTGGSVDVPATAVGILPGSSDAAVVRPQRSVLTARGVPERFHWHYGEKEVIESRTTNVSTITTNNAETSKAHDDDQAETKMKPED
ncbi:MAG: hypothetical protein M1815_005783 [Lichina confinis]|nr:MAG: hypothetical protein M1815_005783 [Lichina confinis]